jgi:hypothetical protein
MYGAEARVHAIQDRFAFGVNAMRCLSFLCFAVICSQASSLRAELYAFEVKGRVVGGPMMDFYQVAIGDEIAFRYTLDSIDQNASSLGGYLGTTAVFETPAGVFSGDPLQGGSFGVQPFSQIVSYGSYMPGYPISLSLRFPPNTLMTDELPLTLPISTATTRSFFVHPFFSVPSLWGTITSYESRLVPEPSSLWLIGATCVALRRRRT